MSARRRHAHKSRVAYSRGQRRMERAYQECRVSHWRQILSSSKILDFRQPHDVAAKVAWLVCNCRRHLHRWHGVNLTAGAAIGWDEELRAKNADDLRRLAESRVAAAARVIARKLVPHRFRRRVSFSMAGFRVAP